ncbi:BRO-N domain-containing protein [Embleya sp. NPDC001921]
MSTGLIPFEFPETHQPVRGLTINGDPWFVARDACAVLSIRNVAAAVSSLDEDEKGVATTDTPGGSQEMTIISEPGLYALIFRSRKAQAKVFRRWVTHEVIPALRRTGRYEMPGVDEPVPATLSWDHAAAYARARHGLGMSRDQWIALLKSGSVLRLNGAPRQSYEDLFWPTLTRWEIHAHSVPYLVAHAQRTRRRMELAAANVQTLIELDQIGRAVGPGDDTPDGFPF